MGRIVGALGMSHIMFPPTGIEEQAERILSHMLEIRRRLNAMRPDLIVLAGADHLNTFTLAMQVTLAIGVSDSFTTLGDGGVPVSEFAGHRAFAEGFARFASRRGFELVQAEEVRPDHGTAFPKLVLDPDNAVPTVPLFINAAMPVPPQPSRCLALGEALAAYVATERPADERVAVVGTGGLSHWLRLPDEGRIAEDFDRAFIAALVAGDAPRVAQMDSDAMIEAAGNGGLEVIAWLFAAGALPGARGEAIYYEPVPAWITGMGAIELFAGATAAEQGH